MNAPLLNRIRLVCWAAVIPACCVLLAAPFATGADDPAAFWGGHHEQNDPLPLQEPAVPVRHDRLEVTPPLDSHTNELPRPSSILAENRLTNLPGKSWLSFDQSMGRGMRLVALDQRVAVRPLEGGFTKEGVLAENVFGAESNLQILVSRPPECSPKPELVFKSLFDGKTFDGWEHSGNWVIEEGAFYRKSRGGSLTYTADQVPDDFELRFEWKVSAGCNSGVYYRPGQVEYQVLDNIGSPYGENARQAAASLFFCMAPSKDATLPVGQWNTARIICQGSVIEHWLNGERVLSFDYNDPKWNWFVQLLDARGGDLTGRGGQLWLQDHGQDVWFRNLRWREIPEGEVIVPAPDFEPMPVTGQALAKEEARVKSMLQAKQKAAKP